MCASQTEVLMRIPAHFFVEWFKIRGRSFPWRKEDVSPFGILLAEVLLKQTRAETVATVWPVVYKKYPTPNVLGSASPEELYSHIACLGFGRQRVMGLHRLSAALVEAGHFPTLPTDLVRLPFVGIYSAHAVACFAFGHRVPIVDLSIARLLSRLAGINPPRDIRRAPEIWEFAKSLLPGTEFVEHNYGLLDFAAGICKARSPKCEECPLSVICDYANK